MKQTTTEELKGLFDKFMQRREELFKKSTTMTDQEFDELMTQNKKLSLIYILVK